MADSQADFVAQELQGPALPARVLSAQELDQRFATAIGENSEWLRAHEKDLLQQHPDWADMYVAVCFRTPSKILAVAEDRYIASEAGIKSPELLELARSEGVPPGHLLTLLLIEGPFSIWDW